MGSWARSVGIGMDYSPASKSALWWAIHNLIQEGDRLIIILVLSPKVAATNKQLFEDTGSPLIPLYEFREINASKLYGLTPDPEVIDMLEAVSKIKGMTVVTKVYWGDPGQKLCEAVGHLKLDALVVGNRGLGVLQRALLGSVSHYVVQNAICPVTVVKLKASPLSKPEGFIFG